MMARSGVLRSKSGSAAAEMALVLPLLMTLLLGSAELGNFLYNEHLVQKAVRDGARYAARQSFSFYEDGSGDCADPTDATFLSNVRTLVKTSLLANGSDRLPNWDENDITITADCFTTADDDGGSTQDMAGIYTGRADGAPVVTVTANMPYSSVIGTAFGFSGAGYNIVASHQAAVMGI